MTHYLLGPVVFLVGLWWFRAALRHYRQDPWGTAASGIWDFLSGFVIHILGGAGLTVLGAYLIYTSLQPGSSIQLQETFPFVSVHEGRKMWR